MEEVGEKWMSPPSHMPVTGLEVPAVCEGICSMRRNMQYEEEYAV